MKRLRRKRSSHHSSSRDHRRERHIRVLAVTLLIVPIISAIALIRSADSAITPYAYHPSFQWSNNTSENLAILAGEAPRYSSAPGAHRPIYTYSVVPGGVDTPEQLRAAISSDREVASHFAGFQYRKARIVTLDRPQLVYLSYRKGGAIYWTRTRHLLPAGERIITDGNIAARTRCANRISVQRQLAIALEEPPAARLDEFTLPPSLVPFPAHYESALSSPGSSPQAGPLGVGPMGSAGTGIVPGGLPISNICKPEKGHKDCNKPPSGPPSGPPPGPPGPPGPPPATVPEPGSVILFCSGAAAVYARLKKKNAKH